MIFAMPGRHPVLLLRVVPVTVARPRRSLIPFDANSVVTGDRGFIIGSFEKATLQRRRGTEDRWVLFHDGQERNSFQRGFEGYNSTCTSQKDSFECTGNSTFEDGNLQAETQRQKEAGMFHLSQRVKEKRPR